jgi:hypothetical protein
MGKETLIIFLGAWVALQSFLGFPLQWDMIMLAILGIAILGLGVLLRRDAIARRTHHTPHAETFIENTPEDPEVIEIITPEQQDVIDDDVRG